MGKVPSVFEDEMLLAGTRVNQNIIWAEFAFTKALPVGVLSIYLAFVSLFIPALQLYVACVSA